MHLFTQRIAVFALMAMLTLSTSLLGCDADDGDVPAAVDPTELVFTVDLETEGWWEVNVEGAKDYFEHSGTRDCIGAKPPNNFTGTDQPIFKVQVAPGDFRVTIEPCSNMPNPPSGQAEIVGTIALGESIVIPVDRSLF